MDRDTVTVTVTTNAGGRTTSSGPHYLSDQLDRDLLHNAKNATFEIVAIPWPDETRMVTDEEYAESKPPEDWWFRYSDCVTVRKGVGLLEEWNPELTYFVRKGVVLEPREPEHACPQCGESTVQPRGHAEYCEECGWPEEDRPPLVMWETNNTFRDTVHPDLPHIFAFCVTGEEDGSYAWYVVDDEKGVMLASGSCDLAGEVGHLWCNRRRQARQRRSLLLPQRDRVHG